MFIGDDDGLYPGAIGTLNELVQRHKVEAVSSDHGAFIWPGHFLECEDGVLAVPLTHSAVVKNSILEARKVFAGKMPYQKLPWLYHGGAASLDLINRLRDGKGRFFCSQIPDLYSAVALSLGTKEFLSVGIPLVIAGSSKHSTGASQLGNKAVGGDNPSAQFNAEGNIPFHESLILGLSLQVVLYETYLQSTHLHDDALRISLEGQLHAAMTAAPRRFREEINKECQLIARKNGFEFVAKENAIARLLLALARIPEFLRTSFLRLEVTPRELGLANISDAAAASSALYSFVRGRPAVLLSLGVGNLAGRVLSRARQFTKRM